MASAKLVRVLSRVLKDQRNQERNLANVFAQNSGTLFQRACTSHGPLQSHFESRSTPYSSMRAFSSGSALPEKPKPPATEAAATEEATPPPSSAPSEAAGEPPAGEPSAPASVSTTNDLDEEWAEVMDESGHLYYWNQRTGETTELGETKPARTSTGEQQQEGDSGPGAGSGAGAGASGAEYVDPRTEAHMPDQTGYYAGMGALIGIVLGWSAQFF